MEYQQLLETLQFVYQHKMPFNQFLGIEIIRLSQEKTEVRCNMRNDLVGNFVRKILHGGVISSILDLTGGLVASVDLLRSMTGMEREEVEKRLARMGTIDLRVDYLRAGQGEYFIATGSVLRTGKRVAVVRTELYNDQGLLIAAGTATYLIA